MKGKELLLDNLYLLALAQRVVLGVEVSELVVVEDRLNCYVCDELGQWKLLLKRVDFLLLLLRPLLGHLSTLVNPVVVVLALQLPLLLIVVGDRLYCLLVGIVVCT